MKTYVPEQVVAIDPGMITTAIIGLTIDGFGNAVYNAGFREFCIKEGKRQKRDSRLTNPYRLYGMTRRVLNEIETLTNISLIAIEEPFVGVNGAAALGQHGVFSAIVYGLCERYRDSVPIVPVSPMTVKKFVGAKQKQFVAREVFRKWGYVADNDNLVDAFAIAMWAAYELDKRNRGRETGSP